jgi:hypothetical protein
MEGLKSTCVVTDVLGQRANVSVQFDPTIFGNWVDKSDNIKDLLATYSDGTVTNRSDNMSHSYAVPARGTPPHAYGTVDQKAVIIMKENWSGKQRRIEIPVPKPSMFYHVEEKGWRVTAVAGADIAAKITAMLPTGKSISFVSGWLKGKQ